MDSIKRKNKFKKVSIITSAFVVIVGVYAGIAWKSHLFPFTENDATPEPGTQTINMNKSKTEKQASADLEKNPEKKLENTQSDTPSTPPIDSESGKQVANVLVTNAGVFNQKVSVSGFVTNVVEMGGVCEYVFTSGNLRVVKTAETLSNATSTTCKTISFSSDELQSSGLWSVVLHYTSTTSNGTSPSKEFSK